MPRRIPATRALVLLLTTIACVSLPATASARVQRKDLGPNDDPTGLVIVSPFRIERPAVPGQRDNVEITLTNDSDQTVDVSLIPTDLEASTDPRNFVEKTEDGEFGAGDWLVPEITDDRLAPWEQLKFNLQVDPPVEATVGTSLAGLSVDTAIAQGKLGTDDQLTGVLRAQALIQVFLTVPGPVDHKLKVLDIDVRDSLVVGSHRFVVWDVTYRNSGTVNEHVSGNFDVRSIFGNSAKRIPIDESLVLRGSTRTQRIVWNDVPWVGVFTPSMRVRGDDARTIKVGGQRVIVFPWWLPVVIGVAIVLPVLFLWWRRRREWKLYLEDEDGAWDDGDEVVA